MEFVISNSKLRDWEEMCPTEFKAKHIDKVWDFEPTEDMEWGNYFETLVIGGGINGAFDFATSKHGAKMQKSVFKERVEAQAKACLSYFKLLGGKRVSRQEYISTTVINPADGQVIPIEGTLDVLYRLPNGDLIVIDLKFTGDTENDFGKFAWGTPEKMDLSQIIHYTLLVKQKYGIMPGSRYWVFDKKKEMNQKLIRCNISDYTMQMHIQRIADAYNEIITSITFNDWGVKNTFENCRACKSPCKFKKIMPDDYIIEL